MRKAIVRVSVEMIHGILDLPKDVAITWMVTELFRERFEIGLMLQGDHPALPECEKFAKAPEIQAIYESQDPPERPYRLVKLGEVEIPPKTETQSDE